MLSMENFSLWLKQELDNRDWRQADLVRLSGLDSAVISNLINGHRKPGTDTCQAIAKAFQIPAEEIYRHAGLLPSKPKVASEIDELIYLIQLLTPEERKEIQDLIRFKIERKGAGIKKKPALSVLKEK